MSKKITINVSGEYTFKNHNVNANEDGMPKNVNGKTYISGQKIRYMILEKMKDFLKEGDNTEISTGDSATGDIATDIRSDLGGYMIAKKGKGERAKTRKSPINVAFAYAKEASDYFDDLFVRFKNDNTPENDDDTKQVINSKRYSTEDIIPINVQLNVDEVGRNKEFEIDGGKFVSEKNNLLISTEEKLRRIEMFIRSSVELVGLANTSRNATSNTPDRVFISFSENREFNDYFNKSSIEQDNYRKRNPIHFIGDNSTEVSVNDAVEKAVEYLMNNSDEIYI